MSFRAAAENLAEKLFYPEIPDPGQMHRKKQKALKPHMPKHLLSKFEDDLDAIEAKHLEHMSETELYEILEYFQQLKGPVQSIRESIHGQVSFIKNIVQAIEGIKDPNMPKQESQKHVLECEKKLLNDFVEDGLRVAYHSDLSPDELQQGGPKIIMVNHQGGGGENYILQALTGIPGRLIVKGSLMNLPYIGGGLRSRQAIPVDREKISDPHSRQEELKKLAKEIAQELEQGGNVFVFIEGTRSRNGAIAATEKRKQWAEDFLAALEAHTSEIEYQKLLMVVSTMISMPDAPEEKLFKTRFRTTNTTLSARLMPADHFTELDSANPYDGKTMFGVARSAHKAMLIDAVLDGQRCFKR